MHSTDRGGAGNIMLDDTMRATLGEEEEEENVLLLSKK